MTTTPKSQLNLIHSVKLTMNVRHARSLLLINVKMLILKAATNFVIDTFVLNAIK